jgi:hypothetical protein
LAVVGHWDSLTEAERLTQSTLVSGFIEDDIKKGGLAGILPVAQFKGPSAKWNREKDQPSAATFGGGGTLTWQESVDYTPVERKLKRVYIASLIDHFVADNYDNLVDYEAIQLMNNKKAMLNKIEDLIIYGDETYSAGTEEFDGLHAMAQEYNTNYASASLNVDMAETALSITQIRIMLDNMDHGVDFILTSKAIARQFDTYIQEAGLTFGSGRFNQTVDELGRRVSMFDDIPIIRSDFLVPEQANTGVGSNARAKNTSGTEMHSMFFIKRGNVISQDPGLSLATGSYGGNMEAGNLWKTTVFDEMEDQDSGGIRLVSYLGLLDGSASAIGRIYDITAAALVA